MSLPCAVRIPRRVTSLVGAAAALLALAATPAWAVAVEGEVALPPGGVEEPPPRLLGFVERRIKNPITELRPYDPRPDCFVFLEGGPADAEAAKAPPKAVVLELGSASFLARILPVVAGSTVDIKNVGKTTHPIYAPDHPDLFEGPPVGPGGIRSAKLQTALRAVVLRSRDSAHVEGRVVALPTRYFARLGRDGSFKIDEVPPGKWTVKIWYRDGWLPATQTVEVGKTAPRVKITLPERLEPKAPAAPTN